MGAVLVPAIMIGVWLMLIVLPRIDPRRANYGRFRGTYDVIVTAVIAFLALAHVAMLGVALGWGHTSDRLLVGGMGLMFAILGNVLPRARPNWFVGIRTPWTLSSDRVWERTHRVGGMMMMLAGLITIAASFAPVPLGLWVGLTCILAASFGAVIYSYVVWRTERRVEG
jgi:uncharacterized membrane protein